MTSPACVILLTACLVAYNHARCPAPYNLPTLFPPEDTRFECARIFDSNHHNPALSCDGDYWDVWNGQNEPDMTDIHNIMNLNGDVWYGNWNNVISSLVVRPGCKLYAWNKKHYFGRSVVFTGVHSRLHDSGWNDQISSLSCFCDFTNKALRCKPTEEYKEITECINPSKGNMVCQHAVTKGMELGQSVTHGRSISHTVEASLGLEIKKIFSVGLKYSRTTTYDWSKSDSSTFSKTTTQTTTCNVPSYTTIKLIQVVGRCGDTVVYTSKFECAKA